MIGGDTHHWCPDGRWILQRIRERHRIPAGPDPGLEEIDAEGLIGIRPLVDDDLDGLMSFYRAGATSGGFESGIRTALQAILASPHFVFRLERVPDDAQAGADFWIADLDLASRLSYFIWGSSPDAELVSRASRGGLSDHGALETEVRRLLDDPRSEALATRFAAQWLRLQDLERIHPDALAYPQFDQTLAESMRRETELFFDNLVREDRSVHLLHKKSLLTIQN